MVNLLADKLFDITSAITEEEIANAATANDAVEAMYSNGACKPLVMNTHPTMQSDMF